MSKFIQQQAKLFSLVFVMGMMLFCSKAGYAGRINEIYGSSYTPKFGGAIQVFCQEQSCVNSAFHFTMLDSSGKVVHFAPHDVTALTITSDAQGNVLFVITGLGFYGDGPSYKSTDTPSIIEVTGKAPKLQKNAAGVWYTNANSISLKVTEYYGNKEVEYESGLQPIIEGGLEIFPATK